MFLTITGYVLSALSVLWFVFKLYVAYTAARSPLGGGGVPTFDGVIFPPFCLIGGLWFIKLGRADVHMPSLLLVWLIGTAFGVAVHFGIARFVRRQSLPTKEKTK